MFVKTFLASILSIFLMDDDISKMVRHSDTRFGAERTFNSEHSTLLTVDTKERKQLPQPMVFFGTNKNVLAVNIE